MHKSEKPVVLFLVIWQSSRVTPGNNVQDFPKNSPDFLFSVQTHDLDLATLRDLRFRVLRKDSGAFLCSEFFLLYIFFPLSVRFLFPYLPSFKSGDCISGWCLEYLLLSGVETTSVTLKLLESLLQKNRGTLKSEYVFIITSLPKTLATFIPFLISTGGWHKSFLSHNSDLLTISDSFLST